MADPAALLLLREASGCWSGSRKMRLAGAWPFQVPGAVQLYMGLTLSCCAITIAQEPVAVKRICADSHKTWFCTKEKGAKCTKR